MHANKSISLINWAEFSSTISAWEVVKNNITGIPKNEFGLWIDPLEPVCVAQKTLTLKCPNLFWKELVEERYFETLKNAATQSGMTIKLIT